MRKPLAFFFLFLAFSKPFIAFELTLHKQLSIFLSLSLSGSLRAPTSWSVSTHGFVTFSLILHAFTWKWLQFREAAVEIWAKKNTPWLRPPQDKLDCSIFRTLERLCVSHYVDKKISIYIYVEWVIPFTRQILFERHTFGACISICFSSC